MKRRRNDPTPFSVIFSVIVCGFPEIERGTVEFLFEDVMEMRDRIETRKVCYLVYGVIGGNEHSFGVIEFHLVEILRHSHTRAFFERFAHIRVIVIKMRGQKFGKRYLEVLHGA